jgi:hypothetical protein
MSRAISKAFEIIMYKTMVKPAVVYGSETWAVNEMDMKRLGTWKRINVWTGGRARFTEHMN